MDTDTRKKKAAIIAIDRSFEVREHFSFVHPMLLRAVRLYCCDHYGSMLWGTWTLSTSMCGTPELS